MLIVFCFFLLFYFLYSNEENFGKVKGDGTSISGYEIDGKEDYAKYLPHTYNS